MSDYIDNDLYFSLDGDFILSSNKDIQDTSQNPYRSLFQEIKARLEDRDSWTKGFGANLKDFVGKKSSEELAEKMKVRIFNELTKYSLVSSSDLNIDIIPTSPTDLLISIRVRTVGNKFISFHEKFSLMENETASRES